MAKPNKVIITCAITGAIHTPSMSPYLPVIPSALTVDWSEWAGTLGEAHGLALQKPVSHQGGWYNP